MSTATSDLPSTGPTTTMTVDRRYRVWAPRASRVVLVLERDSVPMTRDHRGWWVTNRIMRHGERYAYEVDRDGPFPDPRSMCQPTGVHGWSECVDHSTYQWSDASWQPPPLASGVLYELHIGTFSESGTFAGAIAKLPHLVSLGVTHVELMPICEFSGPRGWGYDGVDLFAPHHEYGRPDDLKRFVEACHAHGLAVVLDVVYNHFGPAGNYVGRFGPYFTGRYSTPWGDAVNLDDAGSDEVRRFFCDNALMWLRDYHIDGLRLDAVHALIDTSACHFLEQLSEEVDALEAVVGRHLTLIAESDLNDPRIVRSREAGGYGLDAQWSDDFHHALHALLTGEQSGYYKDFGKMAHFATAMTEAFVYARTVSSHRERIHGRSARGIPGWRFVVATQNHDQIGNRAMGDRLSHLLSVGKLKIAAALLLTSPFVPLLFQGEEWGASTPFLYFTAHEDQTLAAQVSAGRRREFAAFGWDPANIPDPQSPDTFGASQLRWDELPMPPHAEVLDWYRALIALRQRHPSLRDGKYQDVTVTADESRRQLVVRHGSVYVACNLADQPATIDVTYDSHLLLASNADVALVGHSVYLPRESVALFQTDSASGVTRG